MKCITYKEYLLFLLDIATEKEEINRIKKQLKEIEEKQGE